MMRDSVSEIALSDISSKNFSSVMRKKSLPKNNFRGVKKEELQRQTSMYIASMTIDELYTEILFDILHNVGCDVAQKMGQRALFSYAQDAFKISNEKHRRLLEIAKNKKDPKLMINVEIIEAKELKPKDSNGLSDPFVTLYLISNISHRYNTSVKLMTLNPVWEEHFGLPIKENTDDVLCLEVWDFDPAETVKEKLSKIFEVKGAKGITKFLKEIAVTATMGQHANELIGTAKIPLKIIPTSGITKWYTLDKKNKLKKGLIKVRISFGSGKNNQVGEQEHRHIERTILLHELEISKIAPYWWCGNLSPQGEQLLSQHAAHSGLSQTQVSLCSYIVYAGIHQNYPLSFKVFLKLLEKLMKAIQTGGVSEDSVKLFWDATIKLLPSCFNIIRKIRKKTVNEKTIIRQVVEVLQIFSHIISLNSTEIDLLPSGLYPWISFHNDDGNCDILITLNKAILQGASDWLNNIIIENIKNTIHDTGLSRSKSLIKIFELVRSDLQMAIELYDKTFIKYINIQYAKELYIFYQEKLSTVCEPEVKELCRNLKKLYTKRNFKRVSTSDNSSFSLLEGTSVFELYLEIQRFVTLGQGLCPTDCNSFLIGHFHQWFLEGVLQWLDIAAYKSIQRIEKAVDLDQLVNMDSSVRYSSSAVDTLSIFYQVKVFWEQLNWPDAESSYTFIAKIIDDICRCSVIYADTMALKVNGMGDVQDIYERKFEVTKEWCLAINNIHYIKEALDPFFQDLGIEKIMMKISETKTPLEVQRCRNTISNVIFNATDTVQNKIIELLDCIIKKMAPSMKRLLIEGAELYKQDSNVVDRLLMYVDYNLGTLHKELNTENFKRTLAIVWDVLGENLNDIIKSNLKNRRPPTFFANLKKTFNAMLSFFKYPDQCSIECIALLKIEQVLEVNSLETSNLIHEVNLELAKSFDENNDSKYGEISIRCKFDRNNLIIEVINARNLIPVDSNGTCDSFVKLHLLPHHKYANAEKLKTKTRNKTLCPLYEETFKIYLSSKPIDYKEDLLLLSVKNKDTLGYNNQYIGEAFLRLKDIPNTKQPLSSLAQVRKKLSKPTTKVLETDALKALETRQGEKQAKEFLRKLKKKMDSSI